MNKHLPDVIFKGRAAHLASCNYLQEISTNIRTRQSHIGLLAIENGFFTEHIPLVVYVQ